MVVSVDCMSVVNVLFLFFFFFVICFFFFFFFQAEDGIRDRFTWLEFRRVLFRSVIGQSRYPPLMQPMWYVHANSASLQEKWKETNFAHNDTMKGPTIYRLVRICYNCNQKYSKYMYNCFWVNSTSYPYSLTSLPVPCLSFPHYWTNCQKVAVDWHLANVGSVIPAHKPLILFWAFFYLEPTSLVSSTFKSYWKPQSTIYKCI